MTDTWKEKAEYWLNDNLGYAPDDCVRELAGWMEKAGKIEAITKYVDHIEYGGHVIRQPDVAEASTMIAQSLREILDTPQSSTPMKKGLK